MGIEQATLPPPSKPDKDMNTFSSLEEVADKRDIQIGSPRFRKIRKFEVYGEFCEQCGDVRFFLTRWESDWRVNHMGLKTKLDRFLRKFFYDKKHLCWCNPRSRTLSSGWR